MLAGEAALPPGTRARQAAIRRSHAPLGLAASLMYAGQGAMEPLHDRLAAIVAPTLVIAGAEDPVLARAEEVAAAIPGARLALVAGAGHAPHLERPGPLPRPRPRLPDGDHRMTTPTAPASRRLDPGPGLR